MLMYRKINDSIDSIEGPVTGSWPPSDHLGNRHEGTRLTIIPTWCMRSDHPSTYYSGLKLLASELRLDRFTFYRFL